MSDNLSTLLNRSSKGQTCQRKFRNPIKALWESRKSMADNLSTLLNCSLNSTGRLTMKSMMMRFGVKCAALWVLIAVTSPVWLAILAVIAVFWIGAAAS